MIYRDDDRYQFQPRYIQVYRTLRYRPKWMLISLWWIVKWAATGAKLEWTEFDDGYKHQFHKTYWSKIKWFWVMGKSMTCCDTGHLWYMDEVKQQIRSRKK